MSKLKSIKTELDKLLENLIATKDTETYNPFSFLAQCHEKGHLTFDQFKTFVDFADKECKTLEGIQNAK